jgi:hypothetical protein
VRPPCPGGGDALFEQAQLAIVGAPCLLGLRARYAAVGGKTCGIETVNEGQHLACAHAVAKAFGHARDGARCAGHNNGLALRACSNAGRGQNVGSSTHGLRLVDHDAGGLQIGIGHRQFDRPTLLRRFFGNWRGRDGAVQRAIRNWLQRWRLRPRRSWAS